MRLESDLLDTAPADRAWTIAHELSHVLRPQEGTRLEYTRGPLTLAGLLVTGSVVALLTAGYTAVHGSGPDVGLLLALAALCAFGMWMVLIGLVRRDETTTDATDAQVFGEVLTVAGVERVRRNEGALSRYVPTLLRSHPDPAARRGPAWPAAPTWTAERGSRPSGLQVLGRHPRLTSTTRPPSSTA